MFNEEQHDLVYDIIIELENHIEKLKSNLTLKTSNSLSIKKEIEIRKLVIRQLQNEIGAYEFVKIDLKKGE